MPLNCCSYLRWLPCSAGSPLGACGSPSSAQLPLLSLWTVAATAAAPPPPPLLPPLLSAPFHSGAGAVRSVWLLSQERATSSFPLPDQLGGLLAAKCYTYGGLRSPGASCLVRLGGEACQSWCRWARHRVPWLCGCLRLGHWRL